METLQLGFELLTFLIPYAMTSGSPPRSMSPFISHPLLVNVPIHLGEKLVTCFQAGFQFKGSLPARHAIAVRFSPLPQNHLSFQVCSTQSLSEAHHIRKPVSRALRRLTFSHPRRCQAHFLPSFARFLMSVLSSGSYHFDWGLMCI